MQANISLILNVLLLIGVVIAIGRLMKARRQSLSPERYQPASGNVTKSVPEVPAFTDDIIAVRKVSIEPALAEESIDDFPILKSTSSTAPRILNDDEPEPILTSKTEPKLEPVSDLPRIEPKSEKAKPSSASLMMFLLAKENRQFAGYELLQTVLASGLRFGEGHLFHRHQFSSGQGPVLCSLAAATASGVFDLQNIGAFSVRGLCLFMHASNNPTIDSERFAIMLETARQLREGLDAHLLDDQRKPLTSERVKRYYQLLRIEQPELDYESV